MSSSDKQRRLQTRLLSSWPALSFIHSMKKHAFPQHVLYSVCTCTVSSFIRTLAGKLALGIRALNLTADELFVQGTERGTESRSGFSGVDRWVPVYRRRRFVTLPTPDTTVLRRGTLRGQRTQSDTSRYVSIVFCLFVNMKQCVGIRVFVSVLV